ncbi:S4A5 electrogenic sodium bicarbonate cotransporter 4 [Eggerthella sinensis]|uniref:S4A5 electrogenic sodium bicarbonate cotransporter 4 n=1 Tax=Eggerthella sinensis TaxID=242230 RepID=UPI0022DFE5EF|nr:S4A5 electrogenic sodium bicarbonate cotransporter 4 [Eggerthella sinensis]
MSGSNSTVRIGPISLFTLVIILCLAVMAVLSATTAQATYSAAEKQALFTDDTYANESAAQSAVAAIDAALAPVRDADGGLDAALAAVDKALPTDAASAQRDGASVFLTFTTPSGRTLDVELTIKSNATYEISQWKATTQWTNDGPSTMLWPGAA